MGLSAYVYAYKCEHICVPVSMCVPVHTCEYACVRLCWWKCMCVPVSMCACHVNAQ